MRRAKNAVRQIVSGRFTGAFLNYGLGSYLPQIISFFLVPLYSIYISPDEMGMVEIAASTQTLAMLAMRFGLNGGLNRFYFEAKDENDFKEFVLTTCVAGTLIGLAVFALSLWLLPRLVFDPHFPGLPFNPFITLSLVSALLLTAADWQRRILQAREKARLNAGLSIFFGILAISLNLVFVAGFKLGGAGIIYSTLATAGVNFLYSLWALWPDLRGRLNQHHLKYALHYGIPLLPHHLAAWGNQYLNRWLLGGKFNLQAVGEISIASRLSSPISIITGAFANSYSPIYFSWRAKLSAEAAQHNARSVYSCLIIGGAFLVISASHFGSLFVDVFLDPSYGGAAHLVGWLAAAAWLQLLYTGLTAELFYSKATKSISVIFLSATAANLGATYLAIEQGALAASIGQIAGGVVSLLITGWKAQFHFKLPINFYIFGVSITITIASLVATRALENFPIVFQLVAWLILCTTLIITTDALTAFRKVLQLQND